MTKWNDLFPRTLTKIFFKAKKITRHFKVDAVSHHLLRMWSKCLLFTYYLWPLFKIDISIFNTSPLNEKTGQSCVYFRDDMRFSQWWFLFPIPSRITCCLDLKTSVREGQYNLAWQVWVITLDWLFFVPMIYSPSGSSVHGVLQARILEQVAMFSSRESAWPRDWTHISCVSCVGSQILYCWDTREASQYGPGRSKQHQDAP